MSAARSSTAASPRPRPAAPARTRRRHRTARRTPWTRVRWDRIGRTALLIVLVVVAGLYIQHTIEYFTTRSTAVAQRAIVYRLARQNAGLRVQLRTLSQAGTIKDYARSLGMVQAGERPYVILGLPGNGASSSRHRLR